MTTLWVDRHLQQLVLLRKSVVKPGNVSTTFKLPEEKSRRLEFDCLMVCNNLG